jgi:hypothetical protein
MGPLAPLFLTMKGELLEDGAEWFQLAIDAAAEAGARMAQLRAAAGLCRATGDSGPLRAVHDTFTEGFDTPDLLAAQELLTA